MIKKSEFNESDVVFTFDTEENTVCINSCYETITYAQFEALIKDFKYAKSCSVTDTNSKPSNGPMGVKGGEGSSTF